MSRRVRNMEDKKGLSGALNDNWEEWMDWEQDGILDSTSPQDGAGVLSSTSSHSPQSLKKRKVSPESAEGSGLDRIPTAAEGKSVQDRSHSLVEKRYRENLNQKIAVLGDCIPSLRADGKRSENGAGASQKRNKATVLTEAMAYIQHLEKRNTYLEEANLAMKDQMQRQERISQIEIKNTDEERSEIQKQPEEESVTTAEEAVSQSEPRGMIPVPEEMRRLWRNQSQEHYANGIHGSNETPTNSVHVKGGKYITRLVVGSLAGFMVLSSFSSPHDEPHSKHEKREDNGLSASPSRSFPTIIRQIIAHYDAKTLSSSSFLISSFSKAFLVFCVLGLTLFLYLYYSRPPTRKSKASTIPQPAPSVASPLEVRQNAWLTSIQTVWVPRHHILPEMLALILETAAYLTRLVLGWRYYLWLTGRTEEEETADIRAWDIALDAQLSGGDPEVSKGRLVLTLWASGTLPTTPARLMLKALHIRVLFWEPSRFDCVSRVMHKIAVVLARYQWQKASKMQSRLKKSSTHAGLGQSDPLTDHLSALLEQSPDEVLNDGVIQRSHNIVWNRPSEDLTFDAIDSVVDDSAMQGPLDLIASWFSSSKLQAALLKSLENTVEDGRELIASDIELAVQTASPRSITSVCALVAKAVFLETSEKCFSQMTWALPPGFPALHQHIPTTSPQPPATVIDFQILIAAHCYSTLRSYQREDLSEATTHLSTALRLIAQRRGDAGLLASATIVHALAASTLFLKPPSLKGSDVVGEDAPQLLSTTTTFNAMTTLRKDAADALAELEVGTVEDKVQNGSPVGTKEIKTPAGQPRVALCAALSSFVMQERGEVGPRKGSITSASSLDGDADAGYGSMTDGDNSNDDGDEEVKGVEEEEERGEKG